MSSKPDFRSIAKNDAKESKFPVQIDGDYRVYFNEAAYDQMKKHTATTSEVELCGVLIGDVYRDSNGFFLKIDAVIEGKQANNYGAQVTFTHQTWEHINSIKDKQYANQRIVGWYHTHPGFGVFLSGMDVFIQENTFNHPYQVAIVVETKQNVEGCFTWVDGKSVPLQRYWVGEREIKLATGPAESFNVASPSGAEPGSDHRSNDTDARRSMSSNEPAPRMGAADFLLTIMVFVCGFLIGKVLETNNLRVNTQEALQSELYSMLEFASLNSLASKDFADVNERIAAIDQKVQQKDADGASKNLKELNEHIKALEAHYSKKRSNFRSELMDLVQKKETLVDRVNTVVRRQSDLDEPIAYIYILRAGDVMTHNGAAVDPAKLTPNELRAIKMLIEKAVALAPDFKPLIEEKFKSILPLLYPEQAKPVTSPADTKK